MFFSFVNWSCHSSNRPTLAFYPQPGQCRILVLWPRPAKRTPEVLEIILERIRKGEYARNPLPSTRKLAAELGVSKFTIDRAYCAAEKKGS